MSRHVNREDEVRSQCPLVAETGQNYLSGLRISMQHTYRDREAGRTMKMNVGL